MFRPNVKKCERGHPGDGSKCGYCEQEDRDRAKLVEHTKGLIKDVLRTQDPELGQMLRANVVVVSAPTITIDESPLAGAPDRSMDKWLLEALRRLIKSGEVYGMGVKD